MINATEETIPQRYLLQEMSRKDSRGAKLPFSILFRSFSKTNWKVGEEVYLPSAFICGNRSGQVNKNTVGISPEGEKHAHTVYIPLIFMINGKRVIS